ncbi:2-succinyl-5-enolpyruvyl-6-hydroxy-3-cyclohexene-1-carboxylic-acid synthase [Vibrio sp. 10N.286.49.B3]|uniref:2-succinyl-5-enolpyruvyl-6-hydroxy-3- cyclohexene-1-carboxylic-acid synthase n=1 Tax=Vibrio sp. 10N.286.49.B3 TaxID=1880855 RepID=UPI000C85C7AF|nr:2-succinyl-5-enolpyruvyl-6-hydroxy-3-cyclohexene-1-carboxylic-acid synthase [Vibrio sp. 10N.286.49.B3]PMH41869.1 2-succinyl-5-enolpyruvyl-6-hydroxy-3-cyclohexene-1-carboxylic-acid synthase [Vibrio sp. 10N.286.49.B3]
MSNSTVGVTQKGAVQEVVFDQAVMNRIWSGTLLEELARLGVKSVCIAPGSRSTPLTLEAQENAKLTLHTHFDERGLGFFALGLAKASDAPVAIVVTSGTAVANLLPAIAEARLTGEKLVVLTSDRPVQLIDCGANQAIQQQGIFSSHVVGYLNLPSPSQQVGLNWLLTSIDHLLHTQSQRGGAVHINCPFPEPLYSTRGKEILTHYSQTIARWQSSEQPYTAIEQYFSPLIDDIETHALVEKKGVMIVGSIDEHQAQKVVKVANQLGWPVLCDPQSGISSAWAHYDLWLQNKHHHQTLSQANCIIQFGGRIVSKRLNQWISDKVSQQDSEGVAYVVVAPTEQRINQDHLALRHVISDAVTWLSLQSLPALGSSHSGWADPLKIVSKKITEYSQSLLNLDGEINELMVAVDLAQRGKGRDLFIGNSLIVRLVDMLAKLPETEVYSNRGASGIDGLVATAAGVLQARQQPLLMLIGDTSLLYDLNSLALMSKQQSHPAVIVVMNNDGGAIFDLLPVPQQQKQALYQMPHGYQFEHAAKQFHLAYQQPKTLNDYQQAVEAHFTHGQGTLLVEIVTPAEQATDQLKRFIQYVNVSD